MTRRAGSITRPPTGVQRATDRVFLGLASAAAATIVVLMVYIAWEVTRQALPAVRAYGAEFLVDGIWNASSAEFGVFPEIWGTLYSSLLALLIGGIAGVGVAVFLTQDFLPPRVAAAFRTMIEMLAAIPSVVFGLWGIFVVIPFIRPAAVWLHETLGWLPCSVRR